MSDTIAVIGATRGSGLQVMRRLIDAGRPASISRRMTCRPLPRVAPMTAMVSLMVSLPGADWQGGL